MTTFDFACYLRRTLLLFFLVVRLPDRNMTSLAQYCPRTKPAKMRACQAVPLITAAGAGQRQPSPATKFS